MYKKRIFLFASLMYFVATHLFSQNIANQNNRSLPYFREEIVDTLATCQAVRAELEIIAEQGISAFGNSNSSGYNNFTRKYSREIELEQDRLLNELTADIEVQAAVDAEEEYLNMINEASSMKEENFNMYYETLTQGNGFRPTEALKRLVPHILENLYEKWVTNISGKPKIEKLSKALQKELPRNKDIVIDYLKPIIQSRLIEAKKAEFRPRAEDCILRSYIHRVIERMPQTDSPECFSYIHRMGSSSDELEHSIPYLTSHYFNNREALRFDKKKVIMIRNPHYFQDSTLWEWLSTEETGESGNKIQREWVETHYPVEDRYQVDRRHPEYQVREMHVYTQFGRDVITAFMNDSLKGVSIDYVYAIGDVDREIEQVLCLYELEHNQYDINSQTGPLKDAVRYGLITFRESNVDYSWNSSWDYNKHHTPEVQELAEQYIRQLHLDHRNALGDDRNRNFNYLYEFKYRRTERVDGVTFRHYIGEEEKIVVLQRFHYGYYCKALFPFSQVANLNPRDYVINQNIIRQNKILTCSYTVEKYE